MPGYSRVVLRRFPLFVIASGLAMCPTACGSGDTSESGWAIVKVDIVEGPTLASICIDGTCRNFDPDSDVRTAEFSAYVDSGTIFEVIRVGESPDGGATGPSPVGGCMLVELEQESARFVAGCDAPPDNG